MSKLSHRVVFFCVICVCLFLFGSFKGQADDPKLTLDWISLDSYKSVGMSPSSVHWSEDGKRIYFMWNPDKEKDPQLFWVTPAGGAPTRVAEEDRWKLPEGRGDRNEQGTYTVYAKFGDIFLLNIKTGQVKRIFKTEKAEANPRFLKDGERFTFEMERNLYLYEIPTGTISQLTNIRSDVDPKEKPKKTEEEEYLKKQQADLFDIVNRWKDDEERAKARANKQNPKPEPYYLGSKKKRVATFVPSPHGEFVGIVVEDTSKSDQGRLPIMPKYVTESGFVETQELGRDGYQRVKVGAPVSTSRTGVYEVATGEVTWAEVEIKDREVNHNAPVWADDSSKFAFVIGSVDHKDRWIAVLDRNTRRAEIIDHERDEAWIRDLRAGVGGSSMGWLKDNDTLYYLSERDRWWHLYTCQVSTKKVTQLTRGNWEIAFLKLSQDKSKFYLTTTEVHPGERQLYSLPVNGGALTRLTTAEGWHTPIFSPDETTIALSYSDSNTPTELFVTPNGKGAKMKPLTDSTTPEFKSHRFPKPQLITFPDADGNLIYGDLYLPPEPIEGKRPAIFYIHGAGYAQAVYKRWSSARLLHYYLAQQGYVVLSIDYRGSAGYGRDCRTAVYRHMGGKDVDSAVAAVEYLVNNHNVDRKRIGLYGGSYGGFYTLMSLFTHPGVFAAGVARVPVTDWAHYNHGYTSRILNLPYEDEEAYKRSSPIYFADGLQDHLLIVDGIEDNNVLVQDSVRLVQRLIELKKDGWSYQPYPIEPHGFRQETSRLDYNKRLIRFFDQYLKQ